MKLSLNHIAFEITSNCNLNCKYCYNIWKMPDSKLLQYNSYKQSLKTLRKLFKIAAIQNIAFTGGEPLMAERFLEVALYCKMKGKNITIISNGTYGKLEDYQHLINMGVDLFEIPIHSSTEYIHDEMTQLSGSWKKSQETIRYIVENGGYVVPVIVLTKFNAAVLEETLTFIASLGLQRIMLNRYNIGGYALKYPIAISLSPNEMKSAYDVANVLSSKLNLVISSNVCTPRCVLNPSDYPAITFGNCSANVLNRPLTLDIEGNMRLCNHSPVVAGNIYKQELSEILFSDYTEKWETDIPEYCSNCDLWKQCLGGCRAASEQMFNTLQKEDPIIAIKD
ncbi:MAG: radical SAM/SPASM domain-containing protein [Bacteroidales bacterium]